MCFIENINKIKNSKYVPKRKNIKRVKNSKYQRGKIQNIKKMKIQNIKNVRKIQPKLKHYDIAKSGHFI